MAKINPHDVIHASTGLSISRDAAGDDDVSIFEKLCRVPGTRCAWIMDMIEKGMSDSAIAKKLTRIQEKMGWSLTQLQPVDAATIHVYRLAYEDKLSTGQSREIYLNWLCEQREARKQSS